jgi:FecR-like protein
MKNIDANRFKLSPRGVMLALVSAALSEAALANTGHVDFTVGNVVVTEASGRAHALLKGAEVGSGDKIASGADGRAQIRFSDGGYVSLQPNSEFDIKQYRFNGKTDGTESALFGLFKGALRTVTGLVGRVNRNKYQITTPTATIGIRGTGGLIQVNNDGSTLVIGTSGIWSLTNNGGSIDVPAGTAGFAGTNRNVPPQPTTQGPVVPPPQPQIGPLLPPTIVQGNVVGPLGNSIVPTTGSGYVAAFFGAGGPNFTPFPGGPITAPTNAVFDSAGQPIQFDTVVLVCGLVSCVPTTVTYTLAGTQMEASNDGFLSWGRWTGDVFQNGTLLATLNANQGLHYVTGIPTPAASMPTGGTFTYNLIGATSPTFANGSAAPGVLNSASLTGDFTTSTISVSLSATAGGNTYSGSASALITIASATFSGSGLATSTGTGCSVSCTLGVNGFFSGTGATHAGLLYQFTGVQSGTTTLNGAAAFAR